MINYQEVSIKYVSKEGHNKSFKISQVPVSKRYRSIIDDKLMSTDFTIWHNSTGKGCDNMIEMFKTFIEDCKEIKGISFQENVETKFEIIEKA